MTTMVFVNFPVTDIQASTTFYEKESKLLR